MAATKLYQPQSGIVDWRSYAKLYDRTFDIVRLKKESVPREGAQFFAQETTNLETLKIGEVTDSMQIPLRNNDTDRIPLFSPLDGYDKSFTNYQRRAGFLVTRQAIEAQKTRKISSMITGLPNSAAKLEEMLYASVFNGAFATETTGDGSYICAADHYYEDPQYGQWDNLGASGGFTTDSYLEAWLSFQNRKGSGGTPEPKIPKYVYYPTAAAEAVMKVKGSDKYPQNALNAKLPEMLNDFMPVLGHWLTSTTAWYVIADEEQMNRGMTMVWQTKPEYSSISDSMNPDVVMGKRLRMSCSVGAVHGRDIFGNAGA